MLKKTVKVFLFLAVAVFVFNVGVSMAKDFDAFHKEVKEVSALLDEVRDLKARNDATWKPKVYEAFGRLKSLLVQDRSSAEVYLLFARCYWYNDRFGQANSSIRKARYFAPDNIDILIFAGDMYSGEIKKNLAGFQEWDGSEYDSTDEQYNARRAYELALKVEGIDTNIKGRIYVKLGDLYQSVRESARARLLWQKAIDVAPESEAAKEAEARLKGRS